MSKDPDLPGGHDDGHSAPDDLWGLSAVRCLRRFLEVGHDRSIENSISLLVSGEAGPALEFSCVQRAYARGFLLDRDRLIGLTASLIMLDPDEISGLAGKPDHVFVEWLEGHIERAIAIHLSQDEEADFAGHIPTEPLSERFDKVEAQLGLPTSLLLRATNLMNRQEDFARLAMHRIIIEDVPEPQFIKRMGADPHLTRRALRNVLVALSKLSEEPEESDS